MHQTTVGLPVTNTFHHLHHDRKRLHYNKHTHKQEEHTSPFKINVNLQTQTRENSIYEIKTTTQLMTDQYNVLLLLKYRKWNMWSFTEPMIIIPTCSDTKSSRNQEELSPERSTLCVYCSKYMRVLLKVLLADDRWSRSIITSDWIT